MTEDSKKLERLILKSRDKFRALVDGLSDPLMSIDRDFEVINANRALADSLDLHPREVVGSACHKIIYGFDRPCPENGLTCPAVAARESGRLEVVHHELKPEQGDDLDLKYIEIRAMPVPGDQEEATEIILTRRDFTLQKQAEIAIRDHNRLLESQVADRTKELSEANEELTRQRNELSQANDQLLRLQALKKDLTNMVVHDLKGPLSEIQANLEMMTFEANRDYLEEFIEAAQMGSNDLLRMITNLLDVSRLEENRLVLAPEPVDAAALLRKTAERFTPLARLQDVDLSAEAPEDLPLLPADPNILERILNNLVSNALDYTPMEGRVELKAELRDGGFVFEVADTGRGIEPDLHEKIFEKFSQGHDDRPKTSSGLGLTFCKMAVQAHGGEIWVESEPGRGSRFIFNIPYHPDRKDEDSERHERS